MREQNKPLKNTKKQKGWDDVVVIILVHDCDVVNNCVLVHRSLNN